MLPGPEDMATPLWIRVIIPIGFVIYAGLVEVSHRTLCVRPIFQTMPARGYVTGGSQTSRFGSSKGAALVSAKSVEMKSAKRGWIGVNMAAVVIVRAVNC